MHTVPGTKVSLLTKTSTLDCWSWSLPAGPRVCAGFNLEPGSVCKSCYAHQGMYRFPVVENAQEVRLRWWRKKKPERAPVMMRAIASATKKNPYFRVFDSGDFSGVEDIEAWRWICLKMPEVKFWFSTRAWRDRSLGVFLDRLSLLPNVVVRYSALEIDDKRQWVEQMVGRGWVLTSSVSSDEEDACPKQISGSCTLGKCRACWDKNVPHITYHLHGHQVTWKKGK